jgi:DNA-binding transcriptional LysR family regulator
VQWTDRIGRRVKLRDLHIFLAVAQSGSMAKAADRLAVSQPVVSKTISDLEHALGVRLLDRTFQGIELTAYGRAFITCGTAVFDEMRRGVQEIEFLSDPTAGELRIGSTAPMMDGLIPAVLKRLADRYPKITAHPVEGDSPTLCRLLRERKIDLVVARTWGSHYGGDFITEFLFDEFLFVVAGPGNPWTNRRKINFSDLLGEPWVLPEFDNIMGMLISEGFRQADQVLPTPRIVSNSMAVRARLVESGGFLTMLPGSMLHFGAPRLKLKALSVAMPLESQPVEIISLKDRTPNPIARLFVDELRALAKPMTMQGTSTASLGSQAGKTTPTRRFKQGAMPNRVRGAGR